ncbi:zinc-dependent metalloprotease [Lewinella sp. LCG006]|uniref:zinc-dependent metalloprotease n=1 Tax=Lewinella sp. LCG006 TaxID=3231911 RepID=UPI00345F5B78
MKNLWLVLACLCASCTLGFGQDLITNTLAGKRYPKVEQNLKPTVQLIQERKALEGELTEVELFRLANNRSSAQQLQDWVLDPILLELDAQDLMNTLREAPRDISFAVPVGAGKDIILELTQIEVVTENFKVHTASGKETITGPTGLFYTGIVKDDLNSIATLSLFGDQLRMLIGDRASTYVLGKMQDDSGQYVLFDERKLLREEADWNCHTVDTPLPPATEKPKSSDTKMMAGGGCVKVYVETEFQVYTDHSNSLLAVTNYILGVMAESIIAYRNIEVNMEVSEIFVWDIADPYSDEDDEDETGAVLDEFIATRPVFNGDLAHLITTRGIGGGLADGIGSICSAGAPGPHCVSGSLGASFDVSSLPSTSSTFVRVAHEMGHLLGARHTQACVWGPGNNQQIDDCGNSWVLTNGIDEDGDCPGDTNLDGCECCAGDFNVDETDEASAAEGGACFDPLNPVAPNTPNGRGTIMSYCHTQAIGRDILNGFHVEVAAVINSLFLTAACLTDEDCGCEEFTDRTVNGAPIPDGIYYANSSITSSGVATGAAPQVVVFQAGNQIILEPGFIATELFIAQILDDLCTDPAAMSMIVYDQDNAQGTRIANSATSPQGNELTAYPNPTQDILYLNLTTEKEITSAGLRIINQLGQTVYTLPQNQKLEKGQLNTEVNVSSWPAGMYYVVLQTDSETIVRPVMKE